MSRFEIEHLPLAGLKKVTRRELADERGFFSRFFCMDELAAAGWQRPIVQINHSQTRQRGAVRGLHFQRPPHAEMKFVSCTHGSVWDVAVDLREDSPTYLKWHAEILSAQNRVSLLIPEGFAHGFQALEADAELIYLCSEPYHPRAEGGLRYDDEALGIAWPLAVTQVSDKDQRLVPLSSVSQPLLMPLDAAHG